MKSPFVLSARERTVEAGTAVLLRACHGVTLRTNGRQLRARHAVISGRAGALDARRNVNMLTM